jgi:hypothetical protein
VSLRAGARELVEHSTDTRKAETVWETVSGPFEVMYELLKYIIQKVYCSCMEIGSPAYSRSTPCRYFFPSIQEIIWQGLRPAPSRSHLEHGHRAGLLRPSDLCGLNSAEEKDI